MQRKGPVLAVLFTADVLVMLDGMIVAVALPAIGDNVGLRGAELQWAITAYTIPLGSCLLFGGRAADRSGRRRLPRAGVRALRCGLAGRRARPRTGAAPGASGWSGAPSSAD